MWPSQLCWQLKQLRIKPPQKRVRGFNGIQTCGLCVRAAVLYQLSYEDPYIGSRPIWLNKLACSQCMGFYSSVGRALQHKHRGHGFESRWSPENLFFFFGLNYNCDGHIFVSFVFPQFTSFSFFKLSWTGQTAYGDAVVLTSLQVLNFIFFNESEMYPSLDEVSLVTSLNSCQCLIKSQVLTGKYLHISFKLHCIWRVWSIRVWLPERVFNI